MFTLNEEQEKYGYWNRGGGLVQVGLLALKVTFTPDDLMKYTTTECTVNVDVIPRKFRQANTSYIDNKRLEQPLKISACRTRSISSRWPMNQTTREAG